jgi:hypothetical protein
MANNKNLAKAGEKTQFSKERQPVNPGRRPAALSRYIKEQGVALSDIRLMIGSLIFGHTSQELSAMLKDKDHPPPAGVALILGAIVDDLKKNNLGNLEKLMDRSYGKPEKTINHEISAIAPETMEALNAVFSQQPEAGKQPGRVSRRKNAVGKTEAKQ